MKLIPKHQNKSPIRINFDINSYTNDKLGLNGQQKTSTTGTTQQKNQQRQAARQATVSQVNQKADKVYNYADTTVRLKRHTATETVGPKTGEIGIVNTTSQAPVEAPMEQINPEFNVISFGRGVLNFPKTSSNFISAYTPINSEEAQLVLKNAQTNFTTRAITKGYREPLLYMKTVRTPEDAYLTLYQKSPKTSEELTILEKFKRLYNGGGGNIGHNGRQVVMLNPRHPQKDVVANHEIAHYLLKSSQKAPSKDIFNYELA